MWGCWAGRYHRDLGKRTLGLRNKSKGENSIFEKHGGSSETMPSGCSSWKRALQNSAQQWERRRSSKNEVFHMRKKP